MSSDTAVGRSGNGRGDSVTRRLQAELMALMKENDQSATAFPSGDSIFFWSGHIKGADGTVYEGLQFKIDISFPSDYPYCAPTIKFFNCWHPNVDAHGNICLDILQEQWSASFSVATILQSLRSLLADPNNDSPLNSQAAQLWDSPAQYRSMVLKKYYDQSQSSRK